MSGIWRRKYSSLSAKRWLSKMNLKKNLNLRIWAGLMYSLIVLFGSCNDAAFGQEEKKIYQRIQPKNLPTVSKEFDGTLKFMFVGSLSEGKRPLIAIKLVEALISQRVDASLKLYGNGVLLEELEDYIKNSTFFHVFSAATPHR